MHADIVPHELVGSSIIPSYSGTAGDSMHFNDGFGFSTFDVDNDGLADKHCALT